MNVRDGAVTIRNASGTLVARYALGERVRVYGTEVIGEVVGVHRFPRCTAYALQLEGSEIGTYVERELVPA